MLKPEGCNGYGNYKQIQYCCSEENPCLEGEGDCDENEDCKDDLTCGKNNCEQDKFPYGWVDCCEKGKKAKRNISINLMDCVLSKVLIALEKHLFLCR